MGPMSVREGSRGVRRARLVPMMTMMPAAVKRTPARSSCDAVSAASTPNSAYPILMQGNAEPQSAQQMRQPRTTPGVVARKGVRPCFSTAGAI